MRELFEGCIETGVLVYGLRLHMGMVEWPCCIAWRLAGAFAELGSFGAL